jgi:lipoprotein-releasing system ATP-binding protein
MTDASQLVLDMRGVRREYANPAGAIIVLDQVDLVLRPGEVVGLVGPSGSGKSSLLHIAGLLERPTAGDVTIMGEAGWRLDDSGRTALRRRKIGFVYQFHLLLQEFDALDNVALPQRIAGRGTREARVEAERLLAQMGLSHRLHHQPGQLSGGEQQRVAIARALANNPRLLLADEPTGNLDPTTSRVVFEALYALARQEGVAALIATHNLELTRYMDRVLVLRDGRVETAPRAA